MTCIIRGGWSRFNDLVFGNLVHPLHTHPRAKTGAYEITRSFDYVMKISGLCFKAFCPWILQKLCYFETFIYFFMKGLTIIYPVLHFLLCFITEQISNVSFIMS